MSTFSGLNAMVRGIYANQVALNTVGHNITNANTEGYSRQKLSATASRAEYVPTATGAVAIGMGVDINAIGRVRDIYADIQYHNENAKQSYYETRVKNYDKLETIFSDATDSGIQESLEAFYQSWVEVSVNASDAAARVSVFDKAKNFTDVLNTATEQICSQIESKYKDIETQVTDVNTILENIVSLNKNIIASEATGASANDLRDARDMEVDRLSEFINVSVVENDFGAYQVNCGGISLVTGVDRLHLEMTGGIPSEYFGVNYGVTDRAIKIRESDIAFMPQSGAIRADFDCIDENKSYIDKMTNMAAFMMTVLNQQHNQGYDMDGNEVNGSVVQERNFFGVTGTVYTYGYDTVKNTGIVYAEDSNGNKVKLTGVDIIQTMKVNEDFYTTGGYKYLRVATAYDNSTAYDKYIADSSTSDTTVAEHALSWGDRTADGSNAVYISELFNLSYDTIRSESKANTLILAQYDGQPNTPWTAIGNQSLNSYYQSSMTELGVNAKSMDQLQDEQGAIMTQIQNWRDSEAGVDWNEELTDMIKYQKAFTSCARCLTAMDECLDRLVNSTGTVGR